ncbi:hypothetical protein L1281_000906 [Neisseria sp. HSC-16F19]|nr:hypothetical protein [Neisseria sp. HSC-16F19]MCP2040324.1 hypothetical protein [Neisseria sp. HSC-16F19]
MQSNDIPYTDILRREFEGEDGSFLLRLRLERHWDEAAFQGLVQAMYRAARDLETADTLPKWLAQGFWLAHTFTAEWVAHPAFPKQAGVDYARGCELLAHLAYYLFHGESPLAEGQLETWIFHD